METITTLDYHVVLGTLSVVIGAIAYVPYLRDVFGGTTKPHPFTWLIFALLNGLVFFGQVAEGAGPGSWNTAMTAFACMTLAGAGFYVSRTYIRPFDWLCFAGALLGVVSWVVTKEPLTAIVVATITDALAFLPTIRKAYAHPQTETASLYVLGTAKYVLGIMALQTFNVATVLFPASISIINVFFMCMLFIRRRTLKHPA